MRIAGFLGIGIGSGRRRRGGRCPVYLEDAEPCLARVISNQVEPCLGFPQSEALQITDPAWLSSFCTRGSSEGGVGPHVEPGVKVGVVLMNDEVAILGLGGGSIFGRDAESETAGSGMVLVALMLGAERTSFRLVALLVARPVRLFGLLWNAIHRADLRIQAAMQ